MRGLLVMGLSHATAPVEVRERLAFNRHQRPEALARLRQDYPAAEAVILSTCNRVELYLATDETGPAPDEVSRFLATFHAVDPRIFASHLYQHQDRAMADHLFRVASSLDSMVIGESQILGQVREAYDAARNAGSARRMLNPLFQQAIAAGKQVMRHTEIGQGRLSLASVAVDCAKSIFDHFHDKTILCVGGGKMAVLILKHLHELKPMRLLVCNRDASRAAALAQQYDGEAASFDHLDEHLISADIVLTSTGSAQPIITRALFEGLLKKRRYRPIFLIDIAMPRDVEASVGDLENVYLYNVDDLQQIVSRTLSSRRDAITMARSIVDREVEEYVQWNHARSNAPLIGELFERYHEMANAELEQMLRTRPGVSPQQEARLRELSRRLVNRLLHDPVRAMRDSGHADVDHDAYRQAMEQIITRNMRLNEAQDD